MANSNIITAGIDTAKDKLDVTVHGQPGIITVPNQPAGWAKLKAWLTQAGAARVGIEATGSYHRGVARYLQKAGYEGWPTTASTAAWVNICGSTTGSPSAG